jgi:ATP-dependent Lon protease
MRNLDEKIKNYFPNESVYKSPNIYSVFAGYNLPSFVKDWLLKKFSDENGNIDSDSLSSFLSKHIAHKGSKIKGILMHEQVPLSLLARIIVEPDIKSGKLRFSIPDLDIKTSEGLIPDHVALRFPELKEGGELWGVVKLLYSPPKGKEKGVIHIIDFKQFKPYKVYLEYFIEQRKYFNDQEWIDLLIRSMEYNASNFDSEEQKLMFLTRLLVFVEPNLNMIELAPKGTGKSYIFNNLSKYGWVISGGTVTRAKLLYDVSRMTPGLITRYDFVALDEIESIKFSEPNEIQGALKNYLESGKFTVANYQGVSSASFILLGNLPLTDDKIPKNKNYFLELPEIFQDSALLDRFHGFIEGWKLPRMREDLKLRGFALNVEFFSEILHSFRNRPEYSDIVIKLLNIPEKSDTRDTKAILKISTALLKLLFPDAINEDIFSEEFKQKFKIYCLDIARKMRKIIKRQISLIDHEFSSEIPDITIKSNN